MQYRPLLCCLVSFLPQGPINVQWTPTPLAEEPDKTAGPLVLPHPHRFQNQSPTVQPHPRPLLVPVALGVPVERREHDGQDSGSIVADQAHDVLIVPVIECTFCHLVGTGGTQWGHGLLLLKNPVRFWEARAGVC